MELVLEQTQQGTSNEVSVSAEGVKELKRKVKIKGEKKEALLTLRQKLDLERLVSYDEIKYAVWDCGTNKSPRPDGFTFKFYRRYWNIIDHDVVAAVNLFFELGYFPPGCNSSFIALIPKNQEAKMVKDFRPISLIGSMYKIITNVLANRYWNIIDHDVVAAVNLFFELGYFPPGCNSSFIALIPKNQEAKMVKDFRPISLIGSMYKIITKVLANRLCLVISDLLLGLLVAQRFKAPLIYLGFRFFSDGTSLWSRFIIAIHGVRGTLDTSIIVSKRSSWLDIVREFKDLSNNVWLQSCWISSLIASIRRHPQGGVEEEQLQQLIESTSSIILPNSRDRWIWRLDSSGEFLVKSARNFIDDSFLPKMETPTRWVKTIPIKINIFAWKVFLDKLPTRLNLSLCGIDIPSIICPLCSITVESTSHLFFSCHLARQLLIKVARWWELEIYDFATYDEWIFWLTNLRVSKGFKNVFEGVCYTTWWVIWKFLNQVLFGNNFPRLDLLFDEIVRLSFNWVSSRCKPSLDWNSWMKNPSSIRVETSRAAREKLKIESVKSSNESSLNEIEPEVEPKLELA
ncbi:RNA-directed DNA polymerase, eukaryota [Tanacetum coccineum]|uniref:RNA-directed DNA polymerase, eukaryota n=1 Tax=Tanacetum coccineum TaxID=301880 RepID=A0ABQ4Y565_9ASTR